MTRRDLLWAAFAASAQAQQSSRRRVFILLGPPGAGKTTHSKILSDRYKIPIVSASELLKKSHGKKSEVSKALKVQLEGGDLLNEQGLNQLIQARIGRGDCYNGFILDGYPTTKSQAEFLSAQLKDLTFPDPVVLHLQISDKQSDDRVRRRGRADDNPANSERRLAEYRNEEAAVMGFYPASQVVNIDSSGDERTVATAIQKALDSRP